MNVLSKYVPSLAERAQMLEIFISYLPLFWQTFTGMKRRFTSAKAKQALYCPDFNTFLILILTNGSYRM